MKVDSTNTQSFLKGIDQDLRSIGEFAKGLLINIVPKHYADLVAEADLSNPDAVDALNRVVSFEADSDELLDRVKQMSGLDCNEEYSDTAVPGYTAKPLTLSQEHTASNEKRDENHYNQDLKR